MSAFIFTLSIFAFWALIGFAVVTVFDPRLRVLQSILVSPAVGIAATILSVFFINRLGVPVKDFGAILVPALALVAALTLAIKRPIFPAKRLLPFVGVLVVALLLAAYPMFNYRFDWLSYGNDDMANYSLAAQRFLNYGFFDTPNLDDFFSGKDYSLAFWFMHVAWSQRSGSELMLALAWAFSGFNAHQVFMPVIMALHLSLIAGVGALVAGIGRKKQASLIAMMLLAISPMTTLGALYQLIGQVGGLALLVAATTLMYRPSPGKTSLVRLTLSGIPVVIVFSAIFVWYPEVLPFLGLGWMLYLGLQLKESKTNKWKVLLPALIAGLIVLLMLNKYAIDALFFMLAQASGGMHSGNLEVVLFPYFLVPSGLAQFWGVIPIAKEITEPFLSLSIAVGAVLFYWLLRYAIFCQIQAASAAISMLIIMIGMGVLLFFRNNDFGLFKLSMFAQPFLMAVVAVALENFKWRFAKRSVTIFLSGVVASAAISQNGYVQKSTGEIFGGLNEIPHASAKKVNQQFSQLFDSLRGQNPNGYILDTLNVVLAKFQSMYTQGESIMFPSRDFYGSIATLSFRYVNVDDVFKKKIVDLQDKQYISQQIKTSAGLNAFRMPAGGANEIDKRTLITTIEKQAIFNDFHQNPQRGYFQKVESPQNHLLFIHSSLGAHYYSGERKMVAFSQLENDPMFPGQKFSSLGENLLFWIIAPSDKPRVVMELTNTVVKQFASELPQPKAQGVPLKFVGRGTGRVFSNPIEPAYIDGMPFVAIDMSRRGKQFPSNKKGLMLLYGRVIPADYRWITTFGRDISLISEDQYHSLRPPANLSIFPTDLANKHLEYSGIYEDGWISEKSFFVLSPRATSKFITVTGSIPQIDDPTFSTVLKLSINGNEISSKNLGFGNFEFKVPVTSHTPKQRIELSFSKFQTLPGADGRISPAKINFIGFD